jgi:hypothetical protein
VRFADLFGTGTQHFVRVTNGRVECWPNLGYGRFGKPVLLGNAPRFAGELDASRLFLADIDGSGTSDLIYVYSDRVEVFFNQSGNLGFRAVISSQYTEFTEFVTEENRADYSRISARIIKGTISSKQFTKTGFT